jgi:hypothetical protein
VLACSSGDQEASCYRYGMPNGTHGRQGVIIYRREGSVVLKATLGTYCRLYCRLYCRTEAFSHSEDSNLRLT